MAKASILVADDEPAVRDICLRSLTHAGYEVVSVNNGREAIECARQELFDLFLTDLNMPGMGGLLSEKGFIFNWALGLGQDLKGGKSLVYRLEHLEVLEPFTL